MSQGWAQVTAWGAEPPLKQNGSAFPIKSSVLISTRLYSVRAWKAENGHDVWWTKRGQGGRQGRGVPAGPPARGEEGAAAGARSGAGRRTTAAARSVLPVAAGTLQLCSSRTCACSATETRSWDTVGRSILKEKVQTANPLGAQGQGATLLSAARGIASLQSSVGRFCGWPGTPNIQGELFFNTDVASSVGLLLNVILFKTVPEFVWVDIFLSQIFLLFLPTLTPCQLPRQLLTSRREGR